MSTLKWGMPIAHWKSMRLPVPLTIRLPIFCHKMPILAFVEGS